MTKDAPQMVNNAQSMPKDAPSMVMDAPSMTKDAPFMVMDMTPASKILGRMSILWTRRTWRERF
jgi:hypothetical protein